MEGNVPLRIKGKRNPYLIIGWEGDVVGPGGIWGRVQGVGPTLWVLTIGVLEVNPELDSIRAQRGRARIALFSRVVLKLSYHDF